MHIGHPCESHSLMSEYFKDGITNGAQWYNVAGRKKKMRKYHSANITDTITNRSGSK